ncbi:MAG: hypothetical protein WDW38_010012 [Sanguina aurantia]
MDIGVQLAHLREQASELYLLIDEESSDRVRAFDEEKISLESLIISLNQSQAIIKDERKRLGIEVAAAKKAADKANLAPVDPLAKAVIEADVVDIQLSLIELNNKVLSIDFEVETAKKALAACTRGDEMDTYSTQLIVMQDTRRMLMEEIKALRGEIFRLENEARCAEEKRSAEGSGWAELSRLEEAAIRTLTRLDRAKQAIYFPESKGYRFSTGTGGIYCAAKDLYVAEVSGRFDLRAEFLPPTNSKGAKRARVSFVLGGVSTGGDTAGASDAPSGSTQPQPSPPSGPSPAHRSASSMPGTGPPAPASALRDNMAALGLSGGGWDGANAKPGSSGGCYSHSHNLTAVLLVTAWIQGTAIGQLGTSGDSRSSSSSQAVIIRVGNDSPRQHDSPRKQHGSLFGPDSDIVLRSDSFSLLQPLSSDPAGVAQPALLKGEVVAGFLSSLSRRKNRLKDFLSGQQQTAAAAAALDAAEGGSGGGSPSATPHAGSPDSDLRTGLTQGFTKGAGAMSKLARSLAAKAPRMGDMGLKLAKGLFNSKSNLQEEQSESLDQPQTQQPSHQDPDPQQEVQQPPPQPQLHPQARSRPQSQSQAEPPQGAQLQGDTQPQTQPQQEVQSYVQGQVQALQQQHQQLSQQQQQQQPRPRIPKAPSLIVLQPDYFDDAGAPLSGSARWSGSSGGRGSSSVHARSQETAQTALEPKSTAGAVGESDVSATTGYDFAAVDGEGGGGMMLTAQEELSPVGRFERQSVGRAVDLNQQQQQQQQQPDALNEADGAKGGPVGAGTPPDSASADAHNAPPPSYAEATAFSDSPKHSDNAFARSGKSFANRPAAPSCLLPSGPSIAGGSSSSSSMGGGGGSRSRAGGAGVSTSVGDAGGVGADTARSFFQDFERRPTRKGVYIQLLAEQVELVGERGSKVPDMSISEISFEVEASASACFEYSHSQGWAARDRLSFSVLRLDHKMKGNSLPLPKAALRALLNTLMPSLLTKALVAALPRELGDYVIASQEGLSVQGEFKMAGPALSTFVADLSPGSIKARGMLGISELEAQALSELLSGRNSLSPVPAGRSSSSSSSAGGVPPVAHHPPLSICQLCRFYVRYSASRLWSPLCNLLNKGLQVVLDSYSVHPSQRFSFTSFMDSAVAVLVRKPVRASFTLERLSLGIDAEVALSTLRDYFERLAREFHKKSQGGEAAGDVVREPLDVQLENLSLWHNALLMKLRGFKSRFRSAGCTVMATAGSDSFQIGAENVFYDGPLRLQVPLEVLMDQDNAFVMDVQLPNQEGIMNTVASVVQEILVSMAGLEPTQTPPSSAAAAAAAFAAVPPPSSASASHSGTPSHAGGMSTHQIYATQFDQASGAAGASSSTGTSQRELGLRGAQVTQ